MEHIIQEKERMAKIMKYGLRKWMK